MTSSSVKTKGSGAAAVVVAAALLAGCGSQAENSAPTATITQSVTITQAPVTSEWAETAPATSTPAPVAIEVTIPEVQGQNARIARRALEQLGLTDVSLSSANPKYQNVFNAANWTVVSIEPPPGSVVDANAPVIMKVYKD
ncbi:PASTA domain-containing protein [Mycolicibacter virginiensis]|uniref:PASTA domain-containing protein n=1 Tax=Mycolicibacter virginiensis TaxID=1795032 RepID=UPI0013FD7F63|nr:PASTA domain-containing protein [Mycolicibacter virginiensis]